MDRSRSHWDQSVEHAALSDVGLRRANNQDSMAVAMAGSPQKWLQRGHLFMVADGMGAHAAGELASKIATDVVPLSYFKLKDRSPPDALRAAVQDANARIFSRGQASMDFKGMGTTVCALALTPRGVVIAHVGDSRAYRWRNHRLEQLTFDHSLLWEMRAAGQITEGDSSVYVPRNIITRSLGPHENVNVDLEGPFPVEAGDIFVLCSDGLSGPVEDDEIGTIVGRMPPNEAVHALVDLANLRGGPDNITVIVVRILSEPQLQELAENDTEDESPPKKPFHPALVGATGVAILAALIFVALGKWPAAAACLLGGAVAAVSALILRGTGSGGHYDFDAQMLGRGPYAAVDCRADAEFVDRLNNTVQQLRDAACYWDWTVDWSRFNRHSSQAKSSAESGDYAMAVSEYCHAISYMMDQIKAQRSRS
jgi:protein phosphatase